MTSITRSTLTGDDESRLDNSTTSQNGEWNTDWSAIELSGGGDRVRRCKTVKSQKYFFQKSFNLNFDLFGRFKLKIMTNFFEPC